MKKNLSFILLFVVSFMIQPVFAQDDAPKRPENIGISDFDTFKNNSFDILDESGKLKKDATRIDGEIKGGALTGVSVDKLKQDYKALKGISASSQALTEKMGQLNDQGKQMLENAKNVNPKLKAPAATNSTNKSIKGLEAARKNLDATSSLVTSNLTLLSNELKSRGESFDE